MCRVEPFVLGGKFAARHASPGGLACLAASRFESVGGQQGGYPPEFPTWAFGEWGLAFYLVRERHGTVMLLDLVWAGP